MPEYSDDELPDLTTLLALPVPSTAGRRRSPRKAKQSGSTAIPRGEVSSNNCFNPGQTRSSPRKQTKESPRKQAGHVKPLALLWSNVPLLPKYGSETEITASSSNSLARSPQQRSIGLTHVDSLLLPLSKVRLDAKSRPKQPNFGSKGEAANPTDSDARTRSTRRVPRQQERLTNIASKFVLSEAACADDFEDSFVDEEEDEDTDLSGFVVDDNVEPSVHESSSDSEIDERAKRTLAASPRKRRLRQGSKNKHIETISPETHSDNIMKPHSTLGSVSRDLEAGLKQAGRPKQDIEIVDLTTSPIRTHDDIFQAHVNTQEHFNQPSKVRRPGDPIDFFNDFDAILRLSPPRSSSPVIVPTKLRMERPIPGEEPTKEAKKNEINREDAFTTPPATPPRSPSKLKSPRKLLSPSKSAAHVSHSAHRQSIDGFWDLEVVNLWHDTYSPKKAPITSPRKNRFLEWLDSDDEDEEKTTGLLNESSGSLPSPCSSPKKSRSPQRSPEKAEKQRLLEEKRTAKLKKQDFEIRKEKLAKALMVDLDDNITSSKLSTLSSSTGGVQIIWSKTLRSTAGRANWRRTIVKPTDSPEKGSSVPEGSKVQHYASIELATKVIDCEARLINTLAHEFCHLANFMVSNVRDQPHGASFKAWATKVTKYLRGHENLMYRGVEVTTKHSYTIDHKYLWVCAGREALDLLKVVPEAEDGCGAEYGRHSKSIDTDKHRCGRCKGALIQVRPKPRKVDPKKSSPRKTLFQKKTALETMTEAIEIVDLSD